MDRRIRTGFAAALAFAFVIGTVFVLKVGSADKEAVRPGEEGHGDTDHIESA